MFLSEIQDRNLVIWVQRYLFSATDSEHCSVQPKNYLEKLEKTIERMCHGSSYYLYLYLIWLNVSILSDLN